MRHKTIISETDNKMRTCCGTGSSQMVNEHENMKKEMDNDAIIVTVVNKRE